MDVELLFSLVVCAHVPLVVGWVEWGGLRGCLQEVCFCSGAYGRSALLEHVCIGALGPDIQESSLKCPILRA